MALAGSMVLRGEGTVGRWRWSRADRELDLVTVAVLSTTHEYSVKLSNSVLTFMIVNICNIV